MTPRARLISILGCLALLGSLAAPLASAHYTPVAHDAFSYSETVSISNGLGNYSKYTESTVINGSVGVTAVLPNGTDQAYYFNDDRYENNQGQQYSWTSSGTFAFSPQTFLYTNGTDNQTGYDHPAVWFFIDNTLPAGSPVTLLNSPLTVVATSVPYDLATGAGSWVKTIFVEGNGSYVRNDDYGAFNVAYNWKAYFDPATGYMVAYLYTELDSNSMGDGFTLTDALTVTQTSYPLTATSPPAAGSSGGSGPSPGLVYLAVGIVVVVIIIVVIAIAVSRARRRHPLPRHSPTGQVTFAPPPMGPPPPGINLTPTGQPAVQQIVIKETVKVNCRYCGSLIDSTAEKCPFCGATRT